MHMMLAKDKPVTPRLASHILLNWGYQIGEAEDGEQAGSLLLTGIKGSKNLIQRLKAGADDYLQKPVNNSQLKAPLHLGKWIIELLQLLLQRLQELENPLANIKVLSGLLPLCSYSRKIRNEQNYWKKLEYYITEHTYARFSHGIYHTGYQGKIIQELQALHPKYPASQP